MRRARAAGDRLRASTIAHESKNIVDDALDVAHDASRGRAAGELTLMTCARLGGG
jgi:hypothetical protein